jgi:toxin CcdB
MAKFDVYQGPEGKALLLDVQADLLDALNTRMVVPLMVSGEAPIPAKRLNPVFEIDGIEYVMVTQFLASVPQSLLKNPVTKLPEQFEDVTTALDMLFQGF